MWIPLFTKFMNRWLNLENCVTSRFINVGPRNEKRVQFHVKDVFGSFDLLRRQSQWQNEKHVKPSGVPKERLSGKPSLTFCYLKQLVFWYYGISLWLIFGIQVDTDSSPRKREIDVPSVTSIEAMRTPSFADLLTATDVAFETRQKTVENGSKMKNHHQRLSSGSPNRSPFADVN